MQRGRLAAEDHGRVAETRSLSVSWSPMVWLYQMPEGEYPRVVADRLRPHEIFVKPTFSVGNDEYRRHAAGTSVVVGGLRTDLTCSSFFRNVGFKLLHVTSRD